MELLNIDGQLLYRMMISASNCLENNKILVNSLNVFPVPDGDTGTNMSMTMVSAVKEIQKLKTYTVENVSEAASNGSLMGARGNSGVILSQILRGFARGIKGKNTLNSKDFASALKEGANAAYKAVMRPTEGTILTVAREAGDKAVELSKSISNITILMDKVVEYSQIVLNKTTDMLPALKQAGVVDAGGKGLVFIYQGMLEVLKGKDVLISKEVQEDNVAKENIIVEEDIKYGYCTEFIIKSSNVDIEKFKDLLSTKGDSLIVVGGSGIVKVHVHTNDPGDVLSHALKLGELTRIKIDNMREQHRNILDEEGGQNRGIEDVDESKMETQAPKKAGIITVAMGEGIKNIFLDIGADKVIEGGQTMNPSTEDILNAINSINAEDIYILPNNGNIVMAAKQAGSLTDKNVIVIPTKSIPQGIAALTVFNPENDSTENEEMMLSTISYVKTGQVTYAVRNTTFNDKEINEGDILGLVNGKINNIGRDVLKVTESLIEDMVSEDDELITILYGKDIDPDMANKLADRIIEKYPDCDVQVHDGGQPLYYFIISVE